MQNCKTQSSLLEPRRARKKLFFIQVFSASLQAPCGHMLCANRWALQAYCRVLFLRSVWSVTQWSNSEGLDFDLGMLRLVSARNEAESNRVFGSEWSDEGETDGRGKKHDIVPFLLFIRYFSSYVSWFLFNSFPRSPFLLRACLGSNM